MSVLIGRLAEIQTALEALAQRHDVPGATLAIASGDDLFEFATGILNVNTGVTTTTKSVFQIGSITKLFTTTLVMQLADAGIIELDVPVQRYLSDFTLSDRIASSAITIRQLLTHTSGIQGDYMRGFGRGEDAIAKYVDSLADVGTVHPPGGMWSYCNAGFVVAGRLVERILGMGYDQILRDRICRPIGLTYTTVALEEMLAQRCAVGHFIGPGGRPSVPAISLMEYALAPAGSMTVSTAGEVARFVQVHLSGGTSSNGFRLLSPEAVSAMQQVQVDRPATATNPLRQGLGWLIEDWQNKRVIGHDGSTIGQQSFVQAVLEEQLIVVLLSNSYGGSALWRDLAGWLFEAFAGVNVPERLMASNTPLELPPERYVGVYERFGARYTVTIEGGSLVLVVELAGPLSEEGRASTVSLRLLPVDGRRFVVRQRNGGESIVMFLDFNRGRPSYIFDGRVAPRVTSSKRKSQPPASR